MRAEPAWKVVEKDGFEPPTLRSQSGSSTGLSYFPKLKCGIGFIKDLSGTIGNIYLTGLSTVIRTPVMQSA